MVAFEYLPSEIWELIFFYAEEYIRMGRVMFVNKHWYNLYLSIVYKALSICLGSVRSKYHSILNSPFRPGQWTASITFLSFKSERKYTNIQFFKAETEHITNVTQSNLYRLMMCTPHVEEVKFDFIETLDEGDWAFFYKVLKTADVWKLRYLQDDWDSCRVYPHINLPVVYSIYLKCAQHLQRSLASIRLIEKYIPMDMGVSILHDFVALSYLYIPRGFLKHVNDLDIILQHSPQLEELDVNFSNTRFDSDHPNGRAILNGVYPSIKVLTLHDYVFQTDNQVCIFHNNFTGLRKLQITCAQNKLCLKPETAENFFIMLASLLNFHIRFSGNAIDISDFINESCRQEIHAFVHGKSYVNEDTITICKTKLILKTMVKYEFHPDYSTARHILSRLGPYVQQFELVYLEKEIIQDILEALFSTQHRNINALVFHGLKFKKFTKANLFYTSYIPSITFHDCKFSRQSLQVLSTRFTKLDTVHFKGCRFDKYFDYPWVNIIMPLTDIHTLCISYHVPFSATARENMNELRWHNDGYEMIENPRTFPLVSITLTEEGITRYYYTRDEENPVVVETSETQFHLLAKMVPTRAFFKVIKISVKSIQILSLKLSSDRSKDIQMIF